MNSALKVFLVSGLILSAPLGCAARRPIGTPVPVAVPKPPPPPPPAPPPKKVKLVLLPVEKFQLPNVAAALDEKLAKAEVPGVDERVVAAISMETAQGQAECVQADEECFAKVARLLGADRLLWAEMERSKKAKKKGPVKVFVMFFDAEKGKLISQAEETLKSDVVDKSLDALVSRALFGGGPTAPPPPPPSSHAVSSPPPPSPSPPPPPPSSPSPSSNAVSPLPPPVSPPPSPAPSPPPAPPPPSSNGVSPSLLPPPPPPPAPAAK